VQLGKEIRPGRPGPVVVRAQRLVGTTSGLSGRCPTLAA
jgi:hypothetical protein